VNLESRSGAQGHGGHGSQGAEEERVEVMVADAADEWEQSSSQGGERQEVGG
jgi:hypothetical protein